MSNEEDEVFDVEEKEEEAAEKKEPKNKKKGRARFAQKLSENIKKNSRYVMSPGGNMTLVNINYDFAYELTEIFCETIAQLLIEGYNVVFDQFGRYEVKVQPSRRIKTIFTNNQEVILPELKMLRFYPSPILKARIRGELEGRVKRHAGFMSEEYQKKHAKNIIEGEETESGD